MAGALADPASGASGTRMPALQSRAFVGEGRLNYQVLSFDAIPLGIGYCTVQALLNDLRDVAVGELEYLTRPGHSFTTNQVDD
jgi:hypothetical protein